MAAVTGIKLGKVTINDEQARAIHDYVKDCEANEAKPTWDGVAEAADVNKSDLLVNEKGEKLTEEVLNAAYSAILKKGAEAAKSVVDARSALQEDGTIPTPGSEGTAAEQAAQGTAANKAAQGTAANQAKAGARGATPSGGKKSAQAGGNGGGGSPVAKTELPVAKTPAGTEAKIELNDAQAQAANFTKDKEFSSDKIKFKFIEDGGKKYLSVTPEADAPTGDKTIAIGNAQIKVTTDKAEKSWLDYLNPAKSPIVGTGVFALIGIIVGFFFGRSSNA